MCQVVLEDASKTEKYIKIALNMAEPISLNDNRPLT